MTNGKLYLIVFLHNINESRDEEKDHGIRVSRYAWASSRPFFKDTAGKVFFA